MGIIQTATDHARDKPVLTSLAAGAAMMTAILGGAKALEIDLIPWATAGEIEALEERMNDRDKAFLDELRKITKTQSQLQSTNSVLMREFWEKRLEEAEEELRANPNSRTARAQKLEATRNIELIDLSLRGVAPTAVPDDH